MLYASAQIYSLGNKICCDSENLIQTTFQVCKVHSIGFYRFFFFFSFACIRIVKMAVFWCFVFCTVPPVYYAHLVAFRARHYIDSDSSDGGSIAGVGAHVLRALPEIKGNVKEVMFYCWTLINNDFYMVDYVVYFYRSRMETDFNFTCTVMVDFTYIMVMLYIGALSIWSMMQLPKAKMIWTGLVYTCMKECTRITLLHNTEVLYRLIYIPWTNYMSM